MLIHLVLLLQLVKYEGRPLSVVTGIFATIFSVVGFEILSLGLHAKTYSWSRRFDKNNQLLRKFYKAFNLEAGMILGIGMILGGSSILLYLIIEWLKLNLLPLPHPAMASFAATLVILGFNTVFSSLFISAMSMKNVEAREQQ
jgi:hypothetical protein